MQKEGSSLNQGGVSKLKFYFVYIFYLLTLGNTEKTCTTRGETVLIHVLCIVVTAQSKLKK